MNLLLLIFFAISYLSNNNLSISYLTEILFMKGPKMLFYVAYVMSACPIFLLTMTIILSITITSNHFLYSRLYEIYSDILCCLQLFELVGIQMGLLEMAVIPY